VTKKSTLKTKKKQKSEKIFAENFKFFFAFKKEKFQLKEKLFLLFFRCSFFATSFLPLARLRRAEKKN